MISAAAKPAAAPSSPPALERILYVEDDEDIAEITCLTLQDLGGFQVRHCASGQAALQSFGSFSPQLVLMDVMMPGMDGPETLRQLRQMPASRALPVVFMTARAQTHEQQAYRELGAAGVILKPFDPLSLCDQITKLWETCHDR